MVTSGPCCTIPRRVCRFLLSDCLPTCRQGSTPALFVGTMAFEAIVKQQIKRLEEPALKCCQLVYDELIRILGQLLGKVVSDVSYLELLRAQIIL